ncbi:TetR/AcrR family transcriptional regulator [Acuticoccus kandeliae]|uniref:TetR/AcrR family transcriptional regulator n=1 Tax=Acuticoccus kandeliae TaxID=2073160 RepID=UPI000D3E6E79|nr:TetR/AcrR family transcriptional regulator [Acuticoccus kandeliae]
MGRRRAFDADEVLDVALSVFWKKGFDGTSYADLVEATGVERPSLYAAFGNKEALFRRVLDRYYDHYMDYFPKALAAPTAREVAVAILRGSIELNTRFPDHPGCLNLNGALVGADDSACLRRIQVEARDAGEAEIRARFARAKAEGDLPPDADPAVLAAFITALIHGFAVQAKVGVGRETLEAAAEQAMAGWPKGSGAAP